jgi:hypothetical protein
VHEKSGAAYVLPSVEAAFPEVERNWKRTQNGFFLSFGLVRACGNQTGLANDTKLSKRQWLFLLIFMFPA